MTKLLFTIFVLGLSTAAVAESFQCEARQGAKVLKAGIVDLQGTAGIFQIEAENLSASLNILSTGNDTYTTSVIAKVAEDEKHVFSAEGLRPEFKVGFFVMNYPEFPVSFSCQRLTAMKVGAR